jgi:prolyl oligopeptidase
MLPVLEPPPFTPLEPVTEVLHGVEITDSYRWLEDQNSPLTRKWIEEQTAYTRAYLDAIPGRDRIRKRAEELLAGKDVISDPWNVGNRHFFLKRLRNSEQHSIVMKEGLFGEERVLVDPVLRATGPSTAVSIVTISQDGRFLAYSVRQGGTDHAALEILDVDKSVVLPDRLPDGFCTGFVFAPDATGFYYSHREAHDARPNHKAAFWHHFGTARSQDEEVFVADEKPDVFLGILDSLETKLLAYVAYSTGTSPRTSIYLHRMQPGAVPTLLLHNIEGHFMPFFVRGQLFAYTDVGAPNFRIVRIGLTNPDPAQWRDVVPESRQRLQQFAVAGEQIFVTRIDRFSSRVERFDLDGSQKNDVLSLAHGTVDLLNPTYSGTDLFYRYTSMTEPSVVYCHDTREEKTSIWDRTKVPSDPSLIVVEEVVYRSKDGTLVPLLLAARKDLIHSGPLPTFLTGYGGFGSCVTPRFTAFATFLVEQGFLFAVAALRGGSELGEQWHLAGQRQNRQTAFDDFIAATEWLLSQNRSPRGRIAIGGGSNAGLLVGAAVTQRPDLFRAAICLGPLLDMTRYHLFDFAAGWAEEYGSPDDERDFHSLLAYSPYHRVQDGVEYPAVLLISGDADTRCNPMHARKMAARLQAASRSEWPILLDYKPAWGHTPVQPLSAKIEAVTDRLAFICHELGIQVQHRRSS